MGVHAVRLNENEINSGLFNFIISQQVFADNISGSVSTIVDAAKVDGTLYGDSKFYYSTDVTKTYDWMNDQEAANLLALDRNKEISIDRITLDKFRQIRCTVDDYLTKRAFGDAGIFGSYNAVLLQWIRDTKKVHDYKMYNVFIGTNESTVAGTKQNITVTLPTHAETGETAVEAEAINRLRGQKLAKEIADLFTDLNDATRDYNDNKYLRSYNSDSLKVVWNSDYVHEIEKIDLPTMFHKVGIEKFSQYIMPGKYFGVKQGEIAAASNDGTFRAIDECEINNVHYFGGDVIEAGVKIESGKCYAVNKKKICIVLKELPPFMSAFEVGTSFYNPRSLTTNHYLTYGYNTLKHLKEMPFIVIKEA